jgi:hypothetical protein
MADPEAAIRLAGARAYTIPIRGPEDDSTQERTATTLVVVRGEAGGLTPGTVPACHLVSCR